jgi:sulfonate transport system permease protein
MTNRAEALPAPRALSAAWSATAPKAQRRSSPRKARLGPGEIRRWGWVIGPALLLLYWSVLSATGFLDSRVLPPPWTALTTGWTLIREGRLQHNLAVSTGRAGVGLALGFVAGVALALTAGLSRLGGYVVDGVVQLKRGIPILAIIPFMVLWFGIGEGMKVATIAASVFFPIYLQTHAALQAIELKQVELAETLGLNRLQFLRHVVVPAVLPGFLTGLRFGVTTAWLALVVVEQLNATSGIGYMVTLARDYAQTDVMLVGLVVYALLGLSSDAAVRLLEARVLRWRRTLGR